MAIQRRDVLAAIIMLRNYSNTQKEWSYRCREIFRIGIELLEISIGIQSHEIARQRRR